MSASSIQDRPAIVSSERPSSSLWKKALDTLSVELKNSLDLTKASHAYILSKALAEAQEIKQVCTQKCWTFKKRNGETIILRDVIEKIIVWVEKFIAVGDAAMQYDTAHAAPVWAAFRFVLQVAVNDKKTFEELIESLEAVSHLITRYAIFEELYLQRESAARHELEDMIVRLYAEVLTFLAKARRYLQSSATRRLVKSTVKFPEDQQMTKIKVLDADILKLAEVLTVDIQIETAKNVASMHALLTSLNEPIKRIVDHTSITAQVLPGSQRLQLLQWLSPVPFSSHHKRHSESTLPGSGQWLLNHDRYLHWRNTSSSSIFLLHGILGSGKTSLASTVVDSFLRESSAHALSIPLAYFYCTRSSAEAERSNPDEIMRSILRQLTVSQGSSSTIHEQVLQEFERRQAVARVDGFEIEKLQAAECAKLILDTTAVNPATIVIDAVDEIESSFRHVLLSALVQIVQDSFSVVKVFVTSRDDSNIHVLLSDAVALRITNKNTQRDMDNFVHRVVSSAIQSRRLLNGVVSDYLKHELVGALIAAAGEMFIWVVRQIENLCRMKTEADVRNAMRTLPKHTLNELYEEAFDQMPKSGQFAQNYATQVFSMLLCAQEALSPEALVHAMAKTCSQYGEILTLDKIIDICLNLVVLDSELNILRFAHISFQEFLETRAEFTPHNVHRVAAATCLNFCLEGFSRGTESELSPKDHFHHYSAVYWAEHCRIAVVDETDHLITNKMEEFVFDGSDVTLNFIDWMQEVNHLVKKLPNDHPLGKALNSALHSGGSPIFTACVFGLASIVDHLAHGPDYNWNQKNDFGQSGLYLAAAFGQRTIVQRLLQHDTQVNAFGGKFSHPLHAACFRGDVGIVKTLLDHAADPKLGSRSALEYALLADNENVALLLLDGEYEIPNQAEFDSILQQAAETGCTDVVQFLQRKYASIYGNFGSPRCRAVEVAIFKGRMGVVERYIQTLGDPKTDMPKGAIATAALGGQNAMINFLVDHELDLNQEAYLGTPLRAASVMCHESTVRLLLRLGASVHTSGSFGEPLQAAAMRGHESITRVLLSHGADVNSQGGIYGTALQAAAHRGHQKIVEILLAAGADVYREGFSRDAFHAASEGGHEGIINLLFERGFEVRHPPPKLIPCSIAATPERNLRRDTSGSREWRKRASMTDFSLVAENMQGASTSEHEIKMPFRAQPEYRSQDDEVCALRVAAANGHVTVVESLLSRLSTAGILDSEIILAFKEACGNGHEKAVIRLLSDQVEVEDLKDALETAALKGHLTVVNLLIDHENRLGLAQIESVDSPIQGTYECDSTARVILNSSSNGGHMRVFRRGQEVVAQRCSEVVSRHLHGQALTIAAANRRVDIFKTLLESNLEYNSEELIAALISVSGWADEEILQLLLKHDAKKVLGIQQYSGGLNHAARNNNSRVVVYWLEKHPEHDNLAVDPATVIDVSANGFLDVLIPLINHIRRKGSFERTLSQCLPVASKNGHDEVVEYLIGKGADVNTVIDFGEDLFYDSYPIPQNKYGSTRKLSALQAALIGFDRFSDNKAYDDEQTRAAASSQKRTIKLLLEKGADPNGINGYERYPLEIAAAYCTVEIVQELISSGAGAETVTREHGTALQAAVHRETNGLPIIKALLGAKSSLPSRDQGKAAALNEALSFFRSWNGNFIESSSIREILNIGPGAVVKFLLANLPDEKAINSGYCLLAQMACMAGDIECIDLLLQRGLDVNFSGYYYGTVLQAASRVGNIKIVECLLKSGAEVNILQGVHGTPLRAAVIQGHEDLVRTLIIHGADVNLRYEEQDLVRTLIIHDADVNLRYEEQHQSVLHLALGSKNNAIFKLLLDAGAEKNIRTNHDQHVLILACKHGDATLVGRLLASGVDVGVSGTKLEHSDHIPYEVATPLHAACANGHFSVVRLLVDHGADIEKTNESSATPLIAAVRAKNLPVVRLLLDTGADVNHAVDVTPLSEAAEKCELEIVKELLSAGAIIGDLSTKENALARACRSRHHIVAELLLANLRGNKYEVEICHEALSAAIESDEREMVRLLLEHGISPSFKMLRCACRVGVQEVVRMLVDTGIDVNEDDGEDEPLLHVAACHSKPDIVQFLISRGANTMIRSARYGSPLIAALEGTLAPILRDFWQPESCQSLAMNLPRATPPPETYVDIDEQLESEVLQCEQIVRMLLDEGAEMDTTIRKFGNVLHLASYMGSEVIVRQLLERMEDINIIGGYFESPLIAGLGGEHPTIVDLLLDRGSDVNQFLPEHGSALHYACEHSSKRLIQSLLDHGADINAYDDKHGSVLAAAIPYSLRSTRLFDEQRAIVELLLRHEPKVRIRECDLLAVASSRYGSDGQNFMRLLFQHDASIVATEAVIVKTIQESDVYSDSSNGVLRLVLEHDGGLGTTPAMVEAAESLRAEYGLSELAKITKMLLENQPLNQATADRLKSLSKQVALELRERAEKGRARYRVVN